MGNIINLVKMSLANLPIIIFPASIIGELSKNKYGIQALIKLNEIGVFNILFIVSLSLLTISYLISLNIYSKKEVSNV
ncbi:MAG: hypothetical protein ACRCXA_08205 [Peptostreptococcaceae bacterium]